MAGYGQFVGYAPAQDVKDPSALNFQLADGKSLLVTGPEAQALKARIDASNAVNPQPTAKVDAQGNRIAIASDAPIPNPSVQVPGMVPSPPPSIARPEEPGTPAPKTGGERVISQEYKGGKLETNYIDASGQPRTRITTQGSPGVSKAQLENQSSQGVALPVGGSETVEGGFEPNADYLEQISNANIDKKLAVNTQADAVSTIADQQAQAAAVQQATAAKELQQNQQKEAEIAARVQKDIELMNQARDEFKSAKVDPNRVFSGAGGTFKLLGAAIGAAMGAAGATLGRTDNFALTTINRAIDRDVAAQELEVRTKGENANNALQQFRMSTGSLEQAKAALKVSQLEMAKGQAMEFEAKYKSADAKANAQATIAGLDESIAKEMEKYRIDSLGKHTAQVSQQVAYPKAGSRGQTIDLVSSQGSQEKTIELSKKRADVGKTEADTAKSAADAQRAAVGGEERPLPPEVNKEIAKQADAINAAFRVKALTANEDEGDRVPGHYTKWTADGKEVQQTVEALVAKEQEAAGVGSTEDDYQRIKSSVYGSGTRAELDRGTDAVIDRAAGAVAQHVLTLPPAQRDKILSTLAPDVRREVINKIQGRSSVSPASIGAVEQK